MDIFTEVQKYADGNHYVDIEDKLPIFLCSIGTHIFNGINKCWYCPFVPNDDGEFAIDNCILRHKGNPIYTPGSRIADTRLHILMRGEKGSGKSILILMFLSPDTGLLYHPHAMDLGLGFRTDIGPNSITEAGMFGSVDENGEIKGRPLAREMCGGFLGFEEFSSLVDAAKKDHSTDMTNQLLTATDNGRVKKAMKAGWVEYLTRFTMWAGTQPARFDLVSGMDRRFFVIDIEMSPEKERQYKMAQAKQASMGNQERVRLAEQCFKIRDWIIKRGMEVMSNPPTGIKFDPLLDEWFMQDSVHSHENDLFRRVAIGYAMMSPSYRGGEPLRVVMTPQLREILDKSLKMRRNIMDADIKLIKEAFWNTEITRSALLKEISRMITMGDYQAAKRWVETNLGGQDWYNEMRPITKRVGRRGIVAYIGNMEEIK